MTVPWRLALKAIPWAAILANAPALAESARRLVSDTRAGRGSPTSADIATLVERIAALEPRDRETVELIAQLTAQNAALTTVTDVLEARARVDDRRHARRVRRRREPRGRARALRTRPSSATRRSVEVQSQGILSARGLIGRVLIWVRPTLRERPCLSLVHATSVESACEPRGRALQYWRADNR